MTGKAKKGNDKRLLWLLKANVHFAAAVLAVAGIVFLCSCSGRNVLFRQSDALLGLHNRTMLALLGLIHLGIGVWLLATRNLLNSGFMMLWLGVNGIIYTMGTAWLEASSPLPVLKLVAWKLEASTTAVGFCWRLVLLYLVVGTLVHLLLVRQRLKRLESEDFMKRWEQCREQRASA